MSSCHGARMAAQLLHHSKRAQDDFYRRLRTKLRAPKAITAAAHKLARIIFRLMTTRHEFNGSWLAVDQLCYQKARRPSSVRKLKLSASRSFRLNRPGEFLRRSP
jgi:hypothetical protein